MHPDRIVLGSEERWAGEDVAQLYEPLGAPVMVTDLRTAEMIKVCVKCTARHVHFVHQ